MWPGSLLPGNAEKRTPSRRDGVTRHADWFTAQGGKLSLARIDQTVPNGTGLFS